MSISPARSVDRLVQTESTIRCAMAIVIISSCTFACWHCTPVAALLHTAAAADDPAPQLLSELQRSILSTFKQHVVGDPNGALASWRLSQDVCNWTGVVCAPEGTGRVVALTLPSQGLSGTITPLLFNLPYLTHLNLSSNSFVGTFPDVSQAGNGSTAGASLLVSLDLSGNRLSGALPASIGTLSRLQSLALSRNDFWGPVPPELGRCDKLVQLELGTASDGQSRSRLNGTIPDTLANCSSLAVLRLSHSDLAGPVPAWLGLTGASSTLRVLDLASKLLTGTIPAALGNLTSLSVLDLIDNQGLRGEVPSQLGSCAKLVSLSLGMSSALSDGRNGIGGTLATLYDQVLSNMTFLQQLSISGTQMTSMIPPDLGSMRSLVILDLHANLLQGEIPPTMGNLTNLEIVYLINNDFTGRLPKEFGRCTRLQVFGVGASSELGLNAASPDLGSYVPNMDMVGSIPAEMGHLPLLSYFIVAHTSIGGEIPNFSNATALVFLNLSQNKLEGTITTDHLPTSLQALSLGFNRLSGPIPPSISNLSNLLDIVIQQNDIEGKIPPEFALCSKLQRIDMGGSSTPEAGDQGRGKITGSIPTEFGQLVELRVLTLSSTQVTGTIPWLGNCTSLITLKFNNNELFGELPAWFSNLTRLETLDVITNRLNGPLHVVDWSRLQFLMGLFLSRNKFSGVIPGSLGMVTRLQVFLASKIELVGILPSSLRNNSQLAVVDLQSNGLSGNISDALDILADTADARSIRVVMLSSNMFQGELPTWIGSRFKNLQMLLLAGNFIEGTIPDTLSLLPALQQARQDDPNNIVARVFNQDTDPPFKLILKNVIVGLFGITYGMTILDLSNNYLRGDIPAELSNLVGLRYLNVSHNHLSGSIPPTFSNVTSLVQLDVSYNNLSGSIPDTLAILNSLDYVDFSFNRLVGRIPFGTRYASASYLGNLGLCGEILFVPCSMPPSPNPTNQEPKPSSRPSRDLPFSWIGFWIGSIVAFLATIGLFLSTSIGLRFIFGDSVPPIHTVQYGFYRPLG